jgi:hypothetical protein
MDVNVPKEVATLQRMTPSELREKYAAVYGEPTVSRNRTWLMRRIAWRIQVNAEGDLSERAKARAAELARDADLRVIPPRQQTADPAAGRTVTRAVASETDGRLPPPGSVITRKYKGAVVQVKVLPDGFEYAGERYASLSAVAKAVTGSHCNGFLFFRLNKAGAA